MVKKVNLPNGKVGNFPDSMSWDEIQTVLQKQFPPTNTHINQNIKNDNNLISQLANNPITNTILGTGDALRNLLSLGYLKNSPSTNFGYTTGSQSSQGLAYNIGDVLGNVGGFIGGGEVLEALPIASKIASTLGSTGIGGVLKRSLGSGMYGAAVNPEDRTKSALEGAALSPVLDAIPAAGKKIINAFQPAKHARKLLDYIGGGTSLEENAKILAQQLKKYYEIAKNKASELYDPILKHSGLGDRPIYRTLNPSGIHAYMDKPEIDILNPKGDLKNLYEKFNKNPTLKNAHDLQSMLGKEAKDIISNNSEERALKNNYFSAQKKIRNHIYNFLESNKKGLGDDYFNSIDNYAENVGPYLDNNKIKEIVKSKKTNPQNIENIFKSPEPGIEKVTADLGDEGKNRILYAALKTPKGKKLTGEALLTNILNLDKKGLSSYITPETASLIKQLESKVRNKNILQRGAGLLLGSQIGKTAGLPGAEVVGGALGALESPKIMNSIYPYLPGNELNNALSKYLTKSGDIGKKAMIANLLNQ